MAKGFRKIAIASLAAVSLAAGVAATSTPAAAWGWHPHHGFGGPALAAGLFGALAVGAIAANQGYGECFIQRQPVTDYYGNVVGFRRVRVCN